MTFIRKKAYTVTVFPSAFSIQAQATIQEGIPYFNVIRDSDSSIIAICPDENNAKFVALSLELVVAYVRGDGAQTRALMDQLSKIRSS